MIFLVTKQKADSPPGTLGSSGWILTTFLVLNWKACPPFLREFAVNEYGRKGPSATQALNLSQCPRY